MMLPVDGKGINMSVSWKLLHVFHFVGVLLKIAGVRTIFRVQCPQKSASTLQSKSGDWACRAQAGMALSRDSSGSDFMESPSPSATSPMPKMNMHLGVLHYTPSRYVQLLSLGPLSPHVDDDWLGHKQINR